MKQFKNYLPLAILAACVLFSSCGDDDVPAEENEEEVITNVTLTFTPTSGTPVVATYIDADGEGSLDPVLTEIDLEPNTTYTLSINLQNLLADDEEEQNITAEIEKTSDEHQFFFGWTDGIFSDPSGTGNIAPSTGEVNYGDTDRDSSNNPVGLSGTTFTTGDGTVATGTFQVVLKHQPNIKTATTTSEDGESDIDEEWTINVQ